MLGSESCQLCVSRDSGVGVYHNDDTSRFSHYCSGISLVRPVIITLTEVEESDQYYERSK